MTRRHCCLCGDLEWFDDGKCANCGSVYRQDADARWAEMTADEKLNWLRQQIEELRDRASTNNAEDYYR